MNVKQYQGYFFVFLILQAIFMFGCEEEKLNQIVAEIQIGDKYDIDYSTCEDNKVRKCLHDFANTAVGNGDTFSFVIQNKGAAELEIYSIKLEGDTAYTFAQDPMEGKDVILVPAYSMEAVEKGSAEAQEVIVRFTPNVAGADLTGRIVIESNAANLDVDENIMIRLKANSVDSGQPKARIEPAECDFGDVGVGVKAFCDVSIHNDGNKDLILESTDWDDATSWGTHKTFFSDTILALPAYVSPGTAMTIRFTATPESSSHVRNTFFIGTNDRSNETLEVELSVVGAEAPTAVAEISSINGIPNTTATPHVEPLDDVVFTGVNSVASRANLAVTEYQWEIVEKPVESSVSLGTPNAETTDFIFSSAAGLVHGVDVAGTFTVKLTVTDSDGAVSSNEARVTLNSIPSDALHIQLTWDSPQYDFDLHLTKDNGAFCAADSCYFGNCKESPINIPGFPSSRPEWDGVSGVTAGDPTLNIDDLSGYGPEDINIDVPVDSTYKVGVHAFSAMLNETVGVTIKIFVHGSLVMDEYNEMSVAKSMWNVSDVQWANGNGTVFPINTTDLENTCARP